MSNMSETIANANALVNSSRQFRNCYREARISAVAQIPQRQQRIVLLRAEVEAVGGPAAFARLHNDVDPTYISQLLNGYRAFGERAARTMEERCGWPPGYLERGYEVDRSKVVATTLSSAHRALIAAFDGLLPEQQEAALADLERRAADNRRNFEELQKKFGASRVKLDREVAKHIKPAPPSSSAGKESVGARTITKGLRRPRKTKK